MIGASSYLLIHSEEEVRRCARLFLRELEGDTAHRRGWCKMLVLLGRNKYLAGETKMAGGEHATARLEQRVLKRADGQHLVDTIRRLEVPLGAYRKTQGKKSVDGADGSDGAEPLPGDALVVYLSLDTKDQLRGAALLLEDLLQQRLLSDPVPPLSSLPTEMLLARTHQASVVSRQASHYVDLDIDTKEPGVIAHLREHLVGELRLTPGQVCALLETRGGYHLVLSKAGLSAEQGKGLFKRFAAGRPLLAGKVTVNSDPAIPVPGTLQGGFPVRFLCHETFLAEGRLAAVFDNNPALAAASPPPPPPPPPTALPDCPSAT